MSDQERQQNEATAPDAPRGKVLWFARRAAEPGLPQKRDLYVRKRITNLVELLFMLLFFDVIALVTAGNEFLFQGITALGVTSAFFVVLLSALSDWIFVLIFRELRKRKQDRDHH